MANSNEKSSRRLFLSNLAAYTKKKHLLKAFQQYDPIEAVVLRKQAVTAYVTFRSTRAAEAALEGTKGLTVNKRKVRIAHADKWHDRHRERKEPTPTPVPVVAQAPPGYKPYSAPTLPPECVARIAEYLSYADRARMEQVSRSWRDGSLLSHRKKLTLTTDTWEWQEDWVPKITMEKFYWAIQRCGPYLTKLDFSKASEHLETQIVTIAAKTCPKLEELIIHPLVIREAAMREIGNLTELRTLKLGNVLGPVDPDLATILCRNEFLYDLEITSNPLTGKCLVNGSNLTRLIIAKCMQLLGTSMAAFVENQDRLRILEISNCHNMMYGELLQALMDNETIRETLQRLKIHGSGHNDGLAEDEANTEQERGDFVVLGDEGIVLQPALPACIRSVTELELSFCGWVNRIFVERMAEHIPHLTILNLSGCTNLRGEFVLDSLSLLTNCTHLYICNMHPTVGGNFLQLMPALQDLQCRDNLGINDEDICGLIRLCRTVEYINVEGCDYLTREVVSCAYEVVRQRVNLAVLYLDLGETGAYPQRGDRNNMYLRINYRRTTPRLF